MIYVSHRLDEILKIGDRVTVLRDGSHVSTKAVAAVTKEGLIADMVGRAVDTVSTVGDRPDRGGRAQRRGPRRHRAVRGRELRTPPRRGAGDCRSRRSRTQRGAGMPVRDHASRCRPHRSSAAAQSPSIPRSRQSGSASGWCRRSGGRAAWSSTDRSPRTSPFPILGRLSRALVMSRRALARVADALVTRLGVKTPSLAQPVRTLSGGNQQKVVTRPVARRRNADPAARRADPRHRRGRQVRDLSAHPRARGSGHERDHGLLGTAGVARSFRSYPRHVRGAGRRHLEAARTSQVEIMRLAVARQAAHQGGAT